MGFGSMGCCAGGGGQELTAKVPLVINQADCCSDRVISIDETELKKVLVALGCCTVTAPNGTSGDRLTIDDVIAAMAVNPGLCEAVKKCADIAVIKAAIARLDEGTGTPNPTHAVCAGRYITVAWDMANDCDVISGTEVTGGPGLNISGGAGNVPWKIDFSPGTMTTQQVSDLCAKLNGCGVQTVQVTGTAGVRVTKTSDGFTASFDADSLTAQQAQALCDKLPCASSGGTVVLQRMAATPSVLAGPTFSIMEVEALRGGPTVYLRLTAVSEEDVLVDAFGNVSASEILATLPTRMLPGMAVGCAVRMGNDNNGYYQANAWIDPDTGDVAIALTTSGVTEIKTGDTVVLSAMYPAKDAMPAPLTNERKR